MPDFTAVAFVPCYNEGDIVPWVIQHLEREGIMTAMIDNWSTDWNGMMIEPPGNEPVYRYYERFPPEGPPEKYEWRKILGRIEELAAEHPAKWCMTVDADEVRRSPRPGERLIDALRRVDAEGYTAVDHIQYDFHPVDNSWDGAQDPERHFQYYTQAKPLSHIKAWKNLGRVDLQRTGGHIADFKEMRVHPERFILKHYPIRNQEQGERKVLRDRVPRWNAEERAMGWHCHYDELAKTRKFIRDVKDLKKWEGI